MWDATRRVRDPSPVFLKYAAPDACVWRLKGRVFCVKAWRVLLASCGKYKVKRSAATVSGAIVSGITLVLPALPVGILDKQKGNGSGISKYAMSGKNASNPGAARIRLHWTLPTQKPEKYRRCFTCRWLLQCSEYFFYR